jgi:DNA-binding CsgD family transcriptional regulator
MPKRSAVSSRSGALSTRSRNRSAGARRGRSVASTLPTRDAAPSSGRIAKRLAREDRRTDRAAQTRWSLADDRELKEFVRRRMPPSEIGQRLGRTPGAVRQHIHKLGFDQLR